MTLSLLEALIYGAMFLVVLLTIQVLVLEARARRRR